MNMLNIVFPSNGHLERIIRRVKGIDARRHLSSVVKIVANDGRSRSGAHASAAGRDILHADSDLSCK